MSYKITIVNEITAQSSEFEQAVHLFLHYIFKHPGKEITLTYRGQPNAISDTSK